MMNRCRLCNKVIGVKYTDHILFCSSCRKAVEEEIGFKKQVEEKELRMNGAKQLNDEVELLKRENEDLKEVNKILKMSLEEKDENCYSLAKENEELKQKLESMK